MPPLTDEKPMSNTSYDKGHRDHHVEYHTTPDGDVQTVVVDPANHNRRTTPQESRLDHRSDSDVRSSPVEVEGWRSGAGAPTTADTGKHSRNLSAHFLDATTLSEGHDSKVPLVPSMMGNEANRSSGHPLLAENPQGGMDYPVQQAVSTSGDKRPKATTLQWDMASTEHSVTRETSGTAPGPKSGQKHRRGLSASMNDFVGVAHRRINSGGNAALVERSKEAFSFAARHHQRVDSAGLDMLSSAVADVSNDDIAAVAGVNASSARREDSFLPPQPTSSSPPMRGYVTAGGPPRGPEHSGYTAGHSAYQHGGVLPAPAPAPQSALGPGPQDVRILSSHGGFPPPLTHPRETMSNPSSPPMHHHHHHHHHHVHAARASYRPPQQAVPAYGGHHYHDPGHFRPGHPNTLYPTYTTPMHPPTYYPGQRGMTAAPPPYPMQQAHGGSYEVPYGTPPATNQIPPRDQHGPKSVVPSPPVQQQSPHPHPSPSGRPPHESTMEKIETDEPLFAQKHKMPPPPPPGASPGGASGQWGYERSSPGGAMGADTHGATGGVGDGADTKIPKVGGPPHRNVGGGADPVVFDGYHHPPPNQNNPSPTSSCVPPMPESRGHHRKLSSLCSLGPIVFDGGESNGSGGGLHRSQLSIGGLEEALSGAAPAVMESSQDKFLQNLHASNSSPGGSAPPPQALARTSPREEAGAGGAPASNNPSRVASSTTPTSPTRSSPTATSTSVSRAYLAGGSSKRVRRKCTVADCTNRVVQGGLCISHGARRKTCAHPGCTKNVKKAGLCSTHGPARRRCDAEGCTKVAVQGGRCIAHGAKKKLCSMEGCTKQAILAGMCKKHHDEHYGIISVAGRGGSPVTSVRNRRGTSSPSETSDDSSDGLCVIVSNSASQASPPTASSSSVVLPAPASAGPPPTPADAMRPEEASESKRTEVNGGTDVTTKKKKKPGHQRGLSIFQEMTAVDSIIGAEQPGTTTSTTNATARTTPPPKGHQRGLSIFTDEAVTETIIRQDGNLMI